MTVPSVRPGRTHSPQVDTLDLPQTPHPDPTPLIRAAVDLDLHPSAFRAYTAALLELPTGRAWSVDDVADAAHITHHAARFAVAQLVDAGLLRARRMVVRDPHGTPRDGKRYFLVGGAR